MTDDDAARRAVLAAALIDIPFDGWTIATMRKAAVTAGLDEIALDRLFPDGVVDLVGLYARDLVERAERTAELSPSTRTSERLRVLIHAWLEALESRREAQRRLVAWGLAPGNTAHAARLPFETANALWWAAGDASVDFGHHTRRLTLAAILTATLLHWLGDESEGRAATRAFVDRRLAEAARLAKLTRALKRVPLFLSGLPDPRRLVRRFGRRCR